MRGYSSRRARAIEAKTLQVARSEALAERIHALLAQRGPSSSEDLRTRLCVASESLFQMAVKRLLDQERARYCSGCSGGTVLRLAGDTRPRPRSLSDLDRNPGRQGSRMRAHAVAS